MAHHLGIRSRSTFLPRARISSRTRLACALAALTLLPASAPGTLGFAGAERSDRLPASASPVQDSADGPRPAPQRASALPADGPHALTPIGTLGGEVTAVTVVGGRAYVGYGPRLRILTDDLEPALLGESAPVPGRISGIAVAGDHAYVTVPGSGLYVFDVADPGAVALIGAEGLPGQVLHVAARGDRVYACGGWVERPGDAAPRTVWRVWGFEVNIPAHPSERFAADVACGALVADESFLYVVDPQFGLRTLSVSGMTPGVEVANLPLPSEGADATAAGIALDGHLAYVVGAGLHIVDVADPTRPRLVGSVPSVRGGRRIVVEGARAYVVVAQSGAAEEEFAVFDVADPTAPRVLAVRGLGASCALGVSDGIAFLGGPDLVTIDAREPAPWPVERGTLAVDSPVIEVDGDRAYFGSVVDGLIVVDLTGTGEPTVVGRLADLPVRGLTAYGARAFATVADAIVALDVEAAVDPVEIGHLVYPDVTGPIAEEGCTLYAVVGDKRVIVVDANDPTRLVLRGTLDLPGDARIRALGVSRGMVCAARTRPDGSTEGSLDVIDARDPDQPVLVRSVGDRGVSDVHVVLNYAYLVTVEGLRVVNLAAQGGPTEIAGPVPLAADRHAAPVQIDGSDQAFFLAVVGNHLGMRLLSGLPPGEPREVAQYAPWSDLTAVAMSARHAVVWSSGFGGARARFVDLAHTGEMHAAVPLDAWIPAPSVAVSGSTAYVASHDGGITTVDVSDPSAPTARARVATRSHFLHLLAEDGLVVGSAPDLWVGQLDDQGRLSPAGHYEPQRASPEWTGISVDDFDVVGRKAYLGVQVHNRAGLFEGRLEIVDLSAPASPALLGAVTLTDGDGVAVAPAVVQVVDDRAYVLGYPGRVIVVVDVRDATMPRVLQVASLPGIIADLAVPASMAVVGAHAFVAYPGGLAVLDVADPGAIRSVAHLPLEDIASSRLSVTSGTLSGRPVVLVGDHDTVWLCDVGEPSASRALARYQATSDLADAAYWTLGTPLVEGGRIYLTAGAGGFQILEPAAGSADSTRRAFLPRVTLE